MITNQQISDVLIDLGEGFDLHEIKDGWFTPKSLLRAVGADTSNIASEPTVRVSLRRGVLEISALDNGKVQIMCYCCFGGDPNKGAFELSELREAVLKLKDHYCPPWPG